MNIERQLNKNKVNIGRNFIQHLANETKRIDIDSCTEEFYEVVGELVDVNNGIFFKVDENVWCADKYPGFNKDDINNFAAKIKIANDGTMHISSVRKFKLG